MQFQIETPRFILREFRDSDLKDLLELESDPEVHKYLGGNPVSDPEQLKKVIQFVQQQYIDHGIGRWAVIDKESNEFLGWSGLKWIVEPMNNMNHYYDLGYRIIRKHWRKGIASETGKAAIEYCFNNLNAEQLYAAAHVDNEGSNAVLNKLGFQFQNTFTEFEGLHNFYNLNNPNHGENH
jgi:[ribosomal protein S5]-alanine N-acetyltransferase